MVRLSYVVPSGGALLTYFSSFCSRCHLFPPPDTWVPPNCKFIVIKRWMVHEKFDLVHFRWLAGAFEEKQWRGVTKQAYESIVPRAWIEQVKPGVTFFSDDGTLPEDSLLNGWGPLFIRAGEASGKDIDTVERFIARIEAGGFVNLH